MANLLIEPVFAPFYQLRQEVSALANFKYKLKPIVVFEVNTVAKAAKKKEKKTAKKKKK